MTSAMPLQLYRNWRSRRSEAAQWRDLLADWDTVAVDWTPEDGRVLILPSDPWTLVGALGDDAMIEAATTQLRDRFGLRVAVATGSPAAEQAALACGWEALPLWNYPFSLPDALAVLRDFRPARVLAMGADVMDGYHGRAIAAQLLALCDLSARAGAEAAVIGFSFNAAPEPTLAPLFARLDRRVRLHVRDSISLGRFTRFSPAPAKLRADVAFLLKPQAGPMTEAVAWIEEARAAGAKVIGFNLHPTLFGGACPIEAVSAALCTAGKARNARFLLLPHDYRRGAEAALLAHIAARVPGAHLLTGEHRAAALKALTGALDAVVAARMHLLIAALGMARPVAAITYQDKFDGLFAHFGMAEDLMLPPQALKRADPLARMIAALIDRLDTEDDRIAARLPAVRALAHRNLEGGA